MDDPERPSPAGTSTIRESLKIRHLQIFSYLLLQYVLLFNHRLKQIGFCDDCMLSIPDLNLAANSFVLRK